MLKNYHSTHYPRCSFTPKTGVAFLKTGFLFLLSMKGVVDTRAEFRNHRPPWRWKVEHRNPTFQTHCALIEPRIILKCGVNRRLCAFSSEASRPPAPAPCRASMTPLVTLFGGLFQSTLHQLLPWTGLSESKKYTVATPWVPPPPAKPVGGWATNTPNCSLHPLFSWHPRRVLALYSFSRTIEGVVLLHDLG